MPNDQEKETSSWLKSLSLAWELGYMIAVPLVVFALGGRFLDKKINSAPWFLLAGIVFAMIISSISVYIKIVKIIGKIK